MSFSMAEIYYLKAIDDGSTSEKINNQTHDLIVLNMGNKSYNTN
jgi:hypothetical protein